MKFTSVIVYLTLMLIIFSCKKRGSSNDRSSNNDDVDCEQLVTNGDSPPNGYYCFVSGNQYNAGRYDEHGDVLGGQTWTDAPGSYCMSFNTNGTVDVTVDNTFGSNTSFTTEWAFLLNAPSCCEYAPASEEGDIYVIIDIDGDDIDPQYRLLSYNLNDEEFSLSWEGYFTQGNCPF